METKRWLIIFTILIILLILIGLLGKFEIHKYIFGRAVSGTASATVVVAEDTTIPVISNALINATSTVVLNTIVKVNATVTDNAAVSNVTIQYDPPNDAPYNNTASSSSGSEYFNNTVVLNQLGQWIFTFHANDTSGNNATSVIAQDLAGNGYIEVVTLATGGGGGGGESQSGGRKTEPEPIDYDLSTQEKITIYLKLGDIKIFSFDNEAKHSIEPNKITDKSITLIIKSSSHHTIDLHVGETKEINLNNDNQNDIKITLQAIINNLAHLTLERLAGAAEVTEGIPETEIPEEKPKIEFPKTSLPSQIQELQPFINIAFVLILLTILVLSITWFKSNFQKRKKEE